MTTDQNPVVVAVAHPLRMWVEALEAILDQAGLPPVVARTDRVWIHRVISLGHVDVVVMGLAPSDGAEPVRAMRHHGPDVGVVVISDSDDPGFIAEVVRAGARGYLPHACKIEELVHAVHAVHRGETWMRLHHVSMLVEGLLSAVPTPHEEPDRLALLTDREREILECLALGMSRQEIANRFRLSSNTVRTHIHNVLLKLEVHSMVAAVSLLRQTTERRGYDGRLASGSS
jgi:DNA-binding NarL/FixJ family response regulator